MLKKIVLVEWSCVVHNPTCPLRMEFGLACMKSIRLGTCSRPAKTMPRNPMPRAIVAQKLLGANDLTERVAT